MFAHDQGESAAGARIGPYRVVRGIGRGGMGAVYLAARADDQYQKRVAIKLIKRGMDTEDIIRRFRNERQILAALDHSNIARLLEGGTTDDGLPYFVMEYIEGKPLIDYCDTHKLTIVERLKLFRNVCSAVHYAHQNLVVHRDIKPGNILVTSDGTPKLLDFGIAKLLNPEMGAQTIDPTATALRMMTPDYASPEQVRGEQITTVSDVYSLGVVLYELLTGHRPYRFKSQQPHEILRIICEEEPERPSTAITRVEEVTTSDGEARITITPESVSKTREGQPDKLRRRLAGDLDNIVLKAMRKEPRRRYSSVEQFSEDIRRHLEGLPVIARKDTLRYRSGKFIKRHRAGVVAAGLIVLVLLGGFAATFWQASVAKAQRARAEAEKAKAERRFNDVRKLANSFMFEFHDAIKDIPGTTRARELLVKRALEYLDSLAQEAGKDPSLQRELATAYERVGQVQGGLDTENLGDTVGALQSFSKALGILQALAQADPGITETQRELAKCYRQVGGMMLKTGSSAGALECIRKAIPIFEVLSASDPTNAEARRNLAAIYGSLGGISAANGDTKGALEAYKRAATMLEELSAIDAGNPEVRRNLAMCYVGIGAAFSMSGERAGVLENYRRALAIFEELSAADPMNSQTRRSLAMIYINISGQLAEANDTAGALENLRKSLVIHESLATADPANVQAKSDLATSYGAIGNMLGRANQFAEAIGSLRKSLAISESLLAADPANAVARRELAYGYMGIGLQLKRSGDAAGALNSYRKSLAIFEAMNPSAPNFERQNLANIYNNIGGLLVKTGSAASAIEHFNKALAIFEALLAAKPADALIQSGLARTYSHLGEASRTLASDAGASASRRVQRLREAHSWYQRCLDLYVELHNRGLLTGGDAGKPGEISKEIAKCDAALAKLNLR